VGKLVKGCLLGGVSLRAKDIMRKGKLLRVVTLPRSPVGKTTGGGKRTGSEKSG